MAMGVLEDALRAGLFGEPQGDAEGGVLRVVAALHGEVVAFAVEAHAERREVRVAVRLGAVQRAACVAGHHLL